MKQRSLIVGAALILVAHGSLLAQGRFGLKAGPSFGNISNRGLLPGNLEHRTGFAGGLYLGSGGLLGFGLEGMYAQRGVESSNVLATAETRLDYIDVPAYLKVSIPVPGVRPFVYAGPQGSYEVKCRTAQGAACADYSTSERKRWTWAGIIGAGLHIGGIFGIEGRYIYGLTDLKPSTVTSSSSYKHRTFMILGSIGR